MKLKIIILVFISTILLSCNLANSQSSGIDLKSEGDYEINKSYDVNIPIQNASINVKITSVSVYSDLTVGLNITWTMTVNEGFSITKHSDYNNYNMNLTDNLGNKYYMLHALGAAGSSVTLENGQSCKGTFIYPAPNSGITSLSFNDDDNGKSISFNVSK